ncbi:unnamed protein product [Sphagnum balticum]
MPVNCNFLHESLVLPAFKRLLLKSGLLCEQHGDKIAELLFDVALERVHSPSLNTLDEQCKCSQFQVECATFNQELQESQACQRREQKWPNEEAVQTAQGSTQQDGVLESDTVPSPKETLCGGN